MVSLALLVMRLTVGTLLTGHGAQKLFGAFGGHGLAGTGGWLESMGLRPGKTWAYAAGAAEFGGGLLTGLGFLNPLGPIFGASAMIMATAKAHWGKPVWVTSGGAELPLTNIALLSAIFLAGPGNISMDRLLGVRVPRWFSFLALLGAAGAAMAGIQQSSQQPAPQPQPAQPDEGEPELPVPGAGEVRVTESISSFTEGE